VSDTIAAVRTVLDMADHTLDRELQQRDVAISRLSLLHQRAARTIDKLREKIRAFGRHRMTCAALDGVEVGPDGALLGEPRGDEFCTCGFAQALAFDMPEEMIILCDQCHTLHVDDGDFATRPHRTHTCHHCGRDFTIKSAPTVGVRP